MEKVTINKFDILCAGEERYRILHIQDNVAFTIKMDCTRYIFRPFKTDELTVKILEKEWSIETKKPGKIINKDHFTDKQLQTFNNRRDAVREIAEIFGPTFFNVYQRGSKPYIQPIREKYHLGRTSFREHFLAYLQSGCDETVLVDKRISGYTTARKKYHYRAKPGPKGENEGIPLTDDVMMQFEEALTQYKRQRTLTIKEVYERMIYKYYFTSIAENGKETLILLPDTHYPSYSQFYYYVKKHLSKKEKDAIKTSQREQRNDRRILKSDSMKDVMGPADVVEIDAWEADVSLVSEINREQTVGRPIVYMMIDVYTRVILAVSVSFENNSVLGLTNLLLNLADDKVAYAAKYGIKGMSPEVWPSNVLPTTIRVDRGSDFRSDAIERVLNELNIDRKLVAPGTGSLKGVVEQEFRQMALKQNPVLENYGLIEKRYDSQHHREAVMTIEEYNAIVVNYVLYHNTIYLKYYKLSKKMMDAHVEPYPCQLWQYGCEKFGNPRPIANKENYLWSLMTPAKASINRQGITWKGLYYWPDDQDLFDTMYEMHNRVKKIDIRYDPRDIGTIYYQKDNQLMAAPLNPNKFGNLEFDGMTYFEYCQYLKYKKTIKDKGQRHNLINDVAIDLSNKAVVQAATSDHYAHPEHMREHRNDNKQLTNAKNAIKNRLDTKELGTNERVLQQIDGTHRQTLLEACDRTAADDLNLDVNIKNQPLDITLVTEQTEEEAKQEMLNDFEIAMEAFEDAQYADED